MEIAKLPLTSLDSNAIHDDPGPFCMSYGFDLGPLIRSIQEFGVINPPIVVRQGEGPSKTFKSEKSRAETRPIQVFHPCNSFS